jgi:hypothetical protein
MAFRSAYWPYLTRPLRSPEHEPPDSGLEFRQSEFFLSMQDIEELQQAQEAEGGEAQPGGAGGAAGNPTAALPQSDAQSVPTTGPSAPSGASDKGVRTIHDSTAEISFLVAGARRDSRKPRKRRRDDGCRGLHCLRTVCVGWRENVARTTKVQRVPYPEDQPGGRDQRYCAYTA